MFSKLYLIQQAIGFRWRGFWVKLRLKSFGCKVGSNFKCRGYLHFRAVPKRNIFIGDNVTIGRNVTFEITPTGKLTLHDHALIADNVLLSGEEEIEVGKWTAIAENVSIRSTFHDMGKDKPYRLQGNSGTPIKIGEDCGIGSNTVVLMGSQIPDGVFIAAGSVVTRKCKMEEYTICGGNPMRFIKNRE